jgi:hypothetical protein
MKRKKWERTSPRFHFCKVIDVNELPQRKRGLKPAPPPGLLLKTISQFITHSTVRVRNLSKKVKKTVKICLIFFCVRKNGEGKRYTLYKNPIDKV